MHSPTSILAIRKVAAKIFCSPVILDELDKHYKKNQFLIDLTLGIVSLREITREVYLHSIPADARVAVEKVEDLLKRPKLTPVAVPWGNGSSLIQ